MARFNVTVDFDWMDEEFNLDEEVKAKIVDSVGNEVKNKIFTQIDNECTVAMENALKNMNIQVDDRINAMMDEFFSTPRTVTDKWGEVIKTNVSVKDIMKKKCDDYMSTFVDDSGRETDYGRKMTRAEYMIKKILDGGMNKTIEETIKKTVDEANKKIREQVNARLGNEVGKLIDLDKLFR